MVAKTALITGITGQDGGLLAKFLLDQKYKIIAPTRFNPDKSKLSTLGIAMHQNIEYIVYSQWSDFEGIFKQYKPDEIYHLAAMSHVGQSHIDPDKVFEVNTMWTIELLKAIKNTTPKSRFFFASSCEIFQKDLAAPVSEKASKAPNNPYGISKLSAHLMVQYYRDVVGLFTCNGILFNHESEIRDKSFVSKKICREVARIVKNGGGPLFLGNIEAKKDWGYAPDYVQFFQSILQQEKAQDYVLSTGVLHSVQDMVNMAFKSLNYTITWQGEGLACKAINNNGEIVVSIKQAFFRPLDKRFLIGDNSKAAKKLDFNIMTPFKDWVKSMTLIEYKKLS